MVALALALTLTLMGTPPSVADTVFQLREGDRLILSDFRGSLDIEGWEGSELRVEADASETVRFELRRSGNRVELFVLDRKDRHRADELVLRVPRWVALDVSGRSMEARVAGVSGPVKVRNLSGDLELVDLSGTVDVGSSRSEVDARGLNGSARISSGSGDVTVLDSRGALDLETTSGDVELVGLAPRSLSVQTTSGEVDFQGQLGPGGPYSFSSHNGDLTLRLRGPVDLDARVLAYDGEFESDFPIRTRGFRSGEDLAFTIGSGGSLLTLEAFGGEIRILRGGS